MPRTKKVDANAPTTNKSTTAQIQNENFESKQREVANFAKATEAIKKMKDVTKNGTGYITGTFNKETLRTYLQNISSNEKGLRNLSRYLYYRSQVYYRLVDYNANMFYLNARSVIPNDDLVEKRDKDAVIKSYNDTLNALDKMNLGYEFLKAYTTCFREDVFYGAYYFNPKSKASTSFYIIPLDPDYCKIDGVYETGDFSFCMDMTYFRRRAELLELWGEPFKSMYEESQRSSVKYQPMPSEYGLCLKAHAEDWETVVPVFSGLLNSLISLVDQEDIADIADEQSIYKMIWMELETLSNSKEPNDWKVDPNITIPYWNRMVNEALPPSTTAAIVPGKINAISFPNNQDAEVNRVENATKSVLNTSGGSQILNSSTISGTTAFNAAIKSDTQHAISYLLPQTESIVNRILSLYVKNPSKVIFFPVSVYTKDEFKASVLKDNEYGLSTKLLVNNLNGFTEKQTIALNFLENECLNLKFMPVQSSHTTSNKEGGGQTKTDTEISDEGEASRDKRDNANG